MVDSGAVTHVCPPWFSTETTVHELHQSETPNLRTATDDAIKVYGYNWVYMINNKNQAIVIPFYVCDVAQPILSATRLAEQGFEITLSEQPTIKHTDGFEPALKQQHGLYYLTVKTAGTPVNTRLDIAETEQGIKATISPVTMTSTGAKWVTHNNDVWIYNSQGFLVRLHKRQRQTTYVPDKQCPVPMDKLEDYRRTIAQRRDGTTEDFEEQLHSLQPTQARRTLDGQPWTGETWFKVKPDFKPPKPTIARPTPTRTDPQESKDIQQSTAPATRHTYKKPTGQTTTPMTQSADTATAIPHPKHTPSTTGDYWIKEGHLWKRVHQQVRTDLYIPQQTHDGPDVTQLGPARSTFVKPTNGNRAYRLEDDWTTKTKATLNIPWTGSTSFEEQVSYKNEYFTIEEEEQQQAVSAKGIKSPDQPTQQERAEHNLTHLPFRSWCKQCVQQSTSNTIWLLLLQVTRWTEDNTYTHRNWCGNRYGNGNSSQQQDSRLQLPRTMHTVIPDGMWKSTSSPQQHSSTVRPRRPSYSTTECNSSKAWKQHLQFDNHQHTHHNHKEVLKDFTEH